MTLTEFLMARIAEDERAARKLAETDRRPVLSLATTINHPGRLLAECEAKRAIVEEHTAPGYSATCPRCVGEPSRTPNGLPVARAMPCPTLRALASVYADHPDYDEEWKP